MTIAFYFSLLAICLLGAMSPGPSLYVVAKNTLAGGRLNGIASALSHALGIAVYAIFAVSGLAILLEQYPVIFKTISYLGAIYLIILGVKALCSKQGIEHNLKSGQSISAWAAAKEGFLVSVLNPKIALFFIALFSPFINQSQSLTDRLILVITPVMLDGIWFCFVAILLSSPLIIQYIQQKSRFIDKFCGVVMLALATKILLS
ncbi:LysE family translocator [Catenovulum sp. 2E275]|uniref:LysE family translocator n=1 Tax=Catenovulum sp. 2E275 TaxID=2980497 RepID=UPI0021CFE871|nr:LysE family translocator [Catenovulum sp. 2E275]MCU4675687.1 LysE family translocator [Catenovulum sp. 2E275]